MTNSVKFKFKSLERVYIKPLQCNGRINRCIQDNGNMLIYSVDYYIESSARNTEFYEDELDHIQISE